jgi:hypothetical protein
MKEYRVTITNTIMVSINENQTTIGDFLTELDDTIRSRTDGAVITKQIFIKCEDEEIK